VIVLDGIDEAVRIPRCFVADLEPAYSSFSQLKRLQPTSSKISAGDTTRGTVRPFETISQVARSMVRASRDGELAEFGKNERFLSKLDEITNGFPLYLHHLIEEMLHEARGNRDVSAVLTRSPGNFTEYVKRQEHHLRQEIKQPELRNFLRYSLWHLARSPSPTSSR